MDVKEEDVDGIVVRDGVYNEGDVTVWSEDAVEEIDEGKIAVGCVVGDKVAIFQWSSAPKPLYGKKQLTINRLLGYKKCCNCIFSNLQYLSVRQWVGFIVIVSTREERHWK